MSKPPIERLNSEGSVVPIALRKSIDEEEFQAWTNTRDKRVGSVVLLQRNVMKTKYLQRDPLNSEEVHNVRKTLTYCMMLAISTSVKKEPFDPTKELKGSHFRDERKQRFAAEDEDNFINKPFKFKDYAPLVFKALRHNFGIDEEEYLNSLTEAGLDKFQSTSKSGCFFFFSGDGQYMIKGTSSPEAAFFRHILRDYWNHVRWSKNSLLTRFCGMYQLKVPHIRKKVYFIVMRSVYSESVFHPCNVVYDLKGSTVGRMAKPGDNVKKDLDFLEERVETGNLIQLPSESDRVAFLQALKNDVVWLQRKNIMDYSLLIGVHDKTKKMSRFLNYKSGRFEEFDYKALVKENEDHIAPIAEDLQDQRTTLARFAKIESGGNETYYVAIIDILQPYNLIKKMETAIKGMIHDSEYISSIPAEPYGERFFQFIEEGITAHNSYESSKLLPRKVGDEKASSSSSKKLKSKRKSPGKPKGSARAKLMGKSASERDKIFSVL